jgi:hypothetical protein
MPGVPVPIASASEFAGESTVEKLKRSPCPLSSENTPECSLIALPSDTALIA